MLPPALQSRLVRENTPKSTLFGKATGQDKFDLTSMVLLSVPVFLWLSLFGFWSSSGSELIAADSCPLIDFFNRCLPFS